VNPPPKGMKGLNEGPAAFQAKGMPAAAVPVGAGGVVPGPSGEQPHALTGHPFGLGEPERVEPRPGLRTVSAVCRACGSARQ
jgi:hypothetical protein